MIVDGSMDPDTFMGILGTDDPARVIFELGSNPDRAQEIMAMPPHRRLTEFVKIAIAPKEQKKTSSASAPVDPITGSGQGSPGDLRDDLSDEEWYARRERQKRAAWLARQGKTA